MKKAISRKKLLAKIEELKSSLEEKGVDLNEELNKDRTMTNTAGFKKLKNYVESLLKEKTFRETVKTVRAKFDIPPKGLPIPQNAYDYAEITSVYESSYEYWKSSLNIAEQYGFSGLIGFIQHYILFGDIEALSEYVSAPIIDVVDIQETLFDVESETTIDLSKIPEDLDKLSIKLDKLSMLKASSLSHPIGIMIHPYMTQRDIIDVVKKMYKSKIEPIQKKYRGNGIKLGFLRKKSTRVAERNKFIYNNRNLPIKELSQLVRESYGDILDYTYIHKIIRDEEKSKN